LRKENDHNKEKKSFLDEFKPFLKTVVDMQYFTFQTINKYKQDFEAIKNELKTMKKSLSVITNGNTNVNELKSEWNDDNEGIEMNSNKDKNKYAKEKELLIKESLLMKKKNIPSNLKKSENDLLKKMPRFREKNMNIKFTTNFDQDDNFFEKNDNNDNETSKNNNNSSEKFSEP